MKIILPKLCCLLAIFAISQAISKHKKSQKIIGGIEVVPHEIPYQAFLEFWNTKEGWYCGGTLISQNYVLTTSTCSYDYYDSPNEVLVVLGAHDIYQTESTQINVYSQDILLNDGYDAYNKIKDVALIKLPYTINYTEYIQPATLAPRSSIGQSYVGALGRVSGWGWDDFGLKEKLYQFLRNAYVEVADLRSEYCQVGIAYTDDVLCTRGTYGDFDIGPCTYDAGSPFTVDDVVVAVTSGMAPYCLPGMSTFHTRVDYVLDWIEEHSDVIIN